MIQAGNLLQRLSKAGFSLYTGVPCSFIKPLINTALDSPGIIYVGATNEGDAVAIACGSEIGGRRGVVMFQNSGLGNAVSPLTSLTATFRIPVLVIVTWRGQPGQAPDEPQHELMGRITPDLFGLMGIPCVEVSEQVEELAPTLARALAHMEEKRTPYALLVRKGVLTSIKMLQRAQPAKPLESPGMTEGEREIVRLDPDDVLATVQASVGPHDVICATTGYTGRALYALKDHENQFYMVGSMGCASSFGLGLALAQPRRRVVVLDGDGAFLMRMGALATIGHERPSNLTHVLLDNGIHESTGGQATVSDTMDPAAVVRACGYQRVLRVSSLKELEGELRGGPPLLKFLHIRTKPRSNRNMPRPTIKPYEVAERLKDWLRRTA